MNLAKNAQTILVVSAHGVFNLFLEVSYCMGSSQQSFTRMKPSIAKTNESAPSPAHSTEDPRRSGSVRNVRGFRASPASTCPHTQTRPDAIAWRRHDRDKKNRPRTRPVFQCTKTGFSSPARPSSRDRGTCDDEVIREHQRQTDAGDAEHPGKRKLARGRGGDGNVLTRCRRAEQGELPPRRQQPDSGTSWKPTGQPA